MIRKTSPAMIAIAQRISVVAMLAKPIPAAKANATHADAPTNAAVACALLPLNMDSFTAAVRARASLQPPQTAVDPFPWVKAAACSEAKHPQRLTTFDFYAGQRPSVRATRNSAVLRGECDAVAHIPENFMGGASRRARLRYSCSNSLAWRLAE